MADTTPPELRQEIATIARDPWADQLPGGILRNQDDTLLTRAGGKGLKLYEEIERDPHAYAVLQKRKMAVIAREWTVEPASDSAPDQKAAEIVERQLKALDFDALSLGLLDAVNKGFAVAEVIWDIVDGELWRSPRRCAISGGFCSRTISARASYDGPTTSGQASHCRSGSSSFTRFGAKDGTPYGLGLGTRLYWPVLFKRNALKFGWCLRTSSVPPDPRGNTYRWGATPQEVQTLLRRDAGDRARRRHRPFRRAWAIQLIEANRSGSVDTYDKLVSYLDAQISECVLGETLSTTIGDTGSFAAASVHNDVREEFDGTPMPTCSRRRSTPRLSAGSRSSTSKARRAPRVYRAKPADEMAEAELRKKNADLDVALAQLGLGADRRARRARLRRWLRAARAVASSGATGRRRAWSGFGDRADTSGALDAYVDRVSKERKAWSTPSSTRSARPSMRRAR